MFEWKQNNHFTVFSAVWLQVRQGEQELERDGARQMEPLAIKKIKELASGFLWKLLQFVQTFKR